MEIPLVPWDDFLVKIADEAEQVSVAESNEFEWKWLEQLCELADEDCISEVEDSFQRIVLIVELDTGDYVLTIRRSDGFPETSPEITSTLGVAFEYDWRSGDALRSLYRQFVDRCLKVDGAVQWCRDISYPFKFQKWEIDDSDPGCIIVVISHEGSGKNFNLFLLVDWSEPNIFPRSINSSAPKHLQGLRLDKWDPSCLFGENLNRIFGYLVSQNVSGQ